MRLQNYPNWKCVFQSLDIIYRPRALSTTDWALLQKQGVVALVPNSFMHGCKQLLHEQIARSALLKLDFFDVTNLLSEQNIPFVPLKGLLLAHAVYAFDYARDSVDIDIAIPAEKHREAIQLLTSSGFDHQRSAYTANTIEVFFCRKKKSMLELHFTLSTAEKFGRFVEEFWQKQEVVEFEGTKFQIPSYEAYLIYLMIHLMRHIDSPRAIWVEDIRRYLVQFNQRLKWDTFLDLAREYRLGNVLYLASMLCNQVFQHYTLDIYFPKVVMEDLQKIRTRHGKILYSYLIPRLLLRRPTPLVKRLHSFGLSENWPDRVSLIREFATRRLRRTNGYAPTC